MKKTISRSCSLNYRIYNKSTGQIYVSSSRVCSFFCSADGEKRLQHLSNVLLTQLRLADFNDVVSLEVDLKPVVVEQSIDWLNVY